jgi:hypothetical protein
MTDKDTQTLTLDELEGLLDQAREKLKWLGDYL